MIRVAEEVHETGVRFLVDGLGDRRTLTYDWFGDVVPEATSHLGSAAVALTPIAMSNRMDLQLEGSVELQLIHALQEWADAWAFLRPDIYGRIRVQAKHHDQPVLPPNRRSGALAFSGGVDSLFAAAEHQTRFGAATDPVLVLVHGFDIPLSDPDGFATARRSAQVAAEALGHPLSWVETNWRRDFSTHWTMEFAAGLTAVLRLWHSQAGQAVLGSDEGSGYGFEVFPWSSNPATNHLLGSPAFPVVTHGFAADRVDKCAVVAQRPELLDVVRVCLVEDAGGRNCGSCEKCLRTKLCFAAAGQRDVPAFADPSLNGLDSLMLHKPHLLSYFEATLDHVPNGLTAAERSRVEGFLDRERRRLLPSVPRRIVRSARYRTGRLLNR
jgi:hypothetical protein